MLDQAVDVLSGISLAYAGQGEVAAESTFFQGETEFIDPMIHPLGELLKFRLALGNANPEYAGRSVGRKASTGSDAK